MDQKTRVQQSIETIQQANNVNELMIQTILQNQQEAVQLAEKNNDQKIVNSYGMTSLMYAIVYSNQQLAETRQCEILVQDKFGNNAAHYCIHYHNLLIFEWILQSQPEVLLQKNLDGQTPIDMVYGRIISENQKTQNYSIYKKQFDLMISFYAQFYQEKGFLLYNGNTPLHYALQCQLINGEIPQIYMIWKNVQNNDKISPLMIASKYQQSEQIFNQLISTRDMTDKNNLTYVDYLLQNYSSQFCIHIFQRYIQDELMYHTQQKVINLLISAFKGFNCQIVQYLFKTFNIRSQQFSQKQVEEIIGSAISSGNSKYIQFCCDTLNYKAKYVFDGHVQQLIQSQNSQLIKEVIEREEYYLEGVIYSVESDNFEIFSWCYQKYDKVDQILMKQYSTALLQLLISKNAIKTLGQLLQQARKGYLYAQNILGQRIGQGNFNGLQYALIQKNIVCAKLLICYYQADQYYVSPLIIALDQGIEDEELYRILINYKNLVLQQNYKQYQQGTTYKDVFMKKNTPQNIINIIQ